MLKSVLYTEHGDMPLKFKPFIGPRAWTFKCPDTGYLFSEATKEDLIRHIVSYRAQNDLAPLENMDIVLENYLCTQPMYEGACEHIPLRRGLVQYIKGGIALFKSLFYKSFVDDAEADRRGALCVSCPLNIFPDKDMFVEWSDDIAMACTKGKRSKYHDQLGNCQACSCVLRAKVWYKGHFGLSREEELLIRSANPKCWQLDK